jgi:hypothetical protein
LCITAVATNAVYIGGSAGLVKRTAANTYTSETIDLTGVTFIENIFYRGAGNLYATRYSGLTPGSTWALYTSDGSGTWTLGSMTVNPPGGLTSYGLTGFGGVPGGTLYALYTDNGGGTFTSWACKSTDGGSTWARDTAFDAAVLPTFDTPYKASFQSIHQYAHSVSADSESNVWLALHRSVAHWNGSAWSTHLLDSAFNTLGLWALGSSVYVVGLTDAGEGGAATVAGYYTTNSGSTWASFSLPSTRGIGDTAEGGTPTVWGFDATHVLAVANGYGPATSDPRVHIGNATVWTPQAGSPASTNIDDFTGSVGLASTGEAFLIDAGTNTLYYGTSIYSPPQSTPPALIWRPKQIHRKPRGF